MRGYRQGRVAANDRSRIVDDPDDGRSYADPWVRTDYEAALGRLVLAHNEVDHRLPKALERVTTRLSADNSLVHFARGTSDIRLRNLDLFQKATPASEPVKIDVGEMRRLNKVRSDVAHGHFAQDPFDGSFTLIGDGKGTGKTARDYTVTNLDEAAEDLSRIAATLRAHEAFVDFPPAYWSPPGAARI